MKRTILFWSIILVVLIVSLKILEYKFINRSLNTGIYIGIIVALAVAFGLWFGYQFFTKKSNVFVQESSLIIKKDKLLDFGLSKREVEILELIEKGHTNQMIADQLFVSLSTIKTHTTNIYSKLDVRNRTQALARALEITNSII